MRGFESHVFRRELPEAGQNSISVENEVNLPTKKHIVSSFSTPDIMRFFDFKDFLLDPFHPV